MSVPFRAPRDQLGASLRDQLSKPLIFVVSLLFLGGLVLVFAPLSLLTKLAESALPNSVVENIQAAPNFPVTGNTAPVPADVSQTPVDALTVRENLPVRVAQVPGARDLVSSQPLQSIPALNAFGSTSQAADLVVFTARGASWVEVIDATASVKLRKTLATGDIVSASGVAPLSVVVGRADVVDVQWRNKPVDLKPVARENVARFEVK
jgi:cytoskeleton protein RodZ